jgi:2-phosphoglycerate kinase
MFGEHRILLIGGSSHVGKSTLAQSLAFHLEWNYCSTDKLARHPGRPWQAKPKKVPNHVADHYLLLSADELITDVLRHYRENVWPLIEDIVAFHATDVSADRLVLEGSALLPDLVNTLNFENIAAIWLTASNEFIKRRIYAASHYESKSHTEKMMVDKFLERNNLFNDQIMNAVNQLGLANVDVENVPSVDELTSICLSAFKKKNSQTPTYAVLS